MMPFELVTCFKLHASPDLTFESRWGNYIGRKQQVGERRIASK